MREFPEGCDQVDAGQGWTLGDVLRGEHDGGLAAGANVLPAGLSAAAVRARRECDARRKFAKSKLLQYIVDDETLKDTVRACQAMASA